jgi:hypothetical protein
MMAHSRTAQGADRVSTDLTSSTNSALKKVTPLWKELLAQRGLSQGTIDHFGITPRGGGWQYPVHPALDARRWKAFDSSATPKYLWLPSKPDDIRFYDCDGGLKQRIAAAGGALWLASGEADVWAFWEGGLPNVTCMFDGEARKIPAWFRSELEQLSAHELRLVPDRDKTGMRFVINVSRALSGASIRIIMRTLPFPPRSKGDVGRLLLAVGAARFRTSLQALPAYVAVFTPNVPPGPPRFVQLPLPHLVPDQRDLYEQWCVNVVEAAALRTWAITPPDSKGFSRNFLCPFHEDRHPSAGWSYRSHGIYCFACGYHDTHEIARALGAPSWEAYKRDYARAARP